MYNYMITRISCRAVCRCCFVTGACLGGGGGMLLGMMERQVISILGGMFLGLLAGIAFGIIGLVFAATFNALSPLTGGIGIQLASVEPLSEPPPITDSAANQQSLFPGK